MFIVVGMLVLVSVKCMYLFSIFISVFYVLFALLAGKRYVSIYHYTTVLYTYESL